MNDQREIIYNERRKVLDGESMRGTIISMTKSVVDKFVSLCVSDEQPCTEWDLNELNQILLPVIPIQPVELTESERVSRITKDQLVERLQKEAVEVYEKKEREFPDAEQIRELERVVLLKVIDKKWMDHIDDMDQLRQGIGLQAYGNKDPKVEYRISGFDMFDEMTAGIQEDTVKLLTHVQVQQKVEREQVAKVTGTNKDDSLAKAPKKREDKKVYPNDPCPCGSGKKYKQCCGRM
jgi:preprotein translocase subunit SecA